MTAGPVGSPDRQIGLMPPGRYVPLVVIVVATAIAGLIGATLTAGGATSNIGGTPAAPVAPPALEIVEGGGEPTIAEVCRAPVSAPDPEPWSASSIELSDNIWNMNGDALTQAWVTGDDGFVFWGDIQNNNFSQAVGRRTLSETELQTWVDSLRAVAAGLDEAGIDFYIVPTPAKWDVYPEKLPEWARALDGSGPLDQLLSAAPELPIIDLRADLRKAAAEHPVYSSVNSHWSDYGAWVGWSTVAACLAATDASFTATAAPAITGVEIIEGGNEFAPWGFSPPEPDWSIPMLASPLLPSVLSIDGQEPVVRGDQQRVALEEMPSTTVTEGAGDERSVLLVRDSMGVSLSPWVQQSFERVRQIRHAFDLGDPTGIPDIVSTAIDEEVQLVILQFAQRHLNAPPVLTSGR